ncbi:MAG: phage tail tape measure protein [Planctomycetes bacterium]|nr:phage tail tape measure protein [Planctomycetota bacterium]
MDYANLGFRVDTTGLVKGVKAMDALDKAGDKVGKTSVKTGGLINKSFLGANAGIDAVTASGTKLTAMFGTLSGVMGTIGLAALAVKTKEYSKALKEVSTLVDTSTFDMKKLTQEAAAQSKQFGAMPTNVVKGYYQAISAGADTAEKATKAMTAANKLAIGGVTHVEIAIDGLTSAMNAYGGQAGSFTDISDAMFVAMKAGKTTIAELSANIGQLAPMASSAGMSFNEMMAATAALTKGGMSTSVAMNGLRAMLAAIVKPTKEAADLAGKLGIEFNAATLKSKGFSAFIEDIKEKTGGSVEQLGLLFGGVESLGPMLALTGQAGSDFNDIMVQMDDKAGATAEAFDKMANTFGFQLNKMLASLTVTVLQVTAAIGNALIPVLKLVADNMWLVEGALVALVTTMSIKVVAAIATYITQKVAAIAITKAHIIALELEAGAAANNAAIIVAAEAKKLKAATAAAAQVAIRAKLALKAAQAEVAAARGTALHAAALVKVKAASVAATTATTAAMKAKKLSAAATVTATNAAAANAAAQTKLTASMVATTAAARVGATAMRGLSGAMALLGGPAGVVILAAYAFISFREEIMAAITTTGKLKTALKNQKDIMVAAKDAAYNYAEASEKVRESIETTMTQQLKASKVDLQALKVRIESTKALLKAAEAQDALNQLNPEYVSMADTHYRVLRDLLKEYKGQAEVVNALEKAQKLLGKSTKELDKEYKDLKETLADTTAMIMAEHKEADKSAKAQLEHAKAVKINMIAHDLSVDMLKNEIAAYKAGGPVLEKYLETVKNDIKEKKIQALMIGDVADETDNLTRELAKEKVELQDLAKLEKERYHSLAKIEQELKQLTQAQELQNVALTQGETAAHALALEMRGYTTEQARSAAETVRNMKIQREFYNALVDALSNASTVKGVLNDLGDWMMQWLKTIIAKFAAQKIMLYFGNDLLAMGTQMMGALMGGGAGVFGAGGLTASANGSMAAASGFGAGQAGAAGAGATGAGMTAGTVLAVVIGKAAVTYIEGQFAGEIASALGGRRDTAANGAMIGSLIGGNLGAIAGGIIGGAFGGGKRRSEGFTAGYREGDYYGQSFIKTQQQRPFFGGTKTTYDYREYDALIDEAVGGFFNRMTNTITTQATIFGSQIGENILKGFTVDKQKFSGGDAAEDFAEFQADALRDAYKLSISRLGPEMQNAMNRAFDIDLTPIEEIEAKMAEFAHTISTMQPMFENAGFNMVGNSGAGPNAGNEGGLASMGWTALAAEADAAAAATLGLTEALGGIEAATSTMQFYLTNFFTQAEQQSMAVDNATLGLAQMNESLGLTGASAITSKEGLTAYLNSLDMTNPAHQALAAIALQGAGNLVTLAQAAAQSDAAIASLADLAMLLGDNFNSGTTGAKGFSDALIELYGSFDEFQSEISELMGNVFSPEELQNLELGKVSQGIIEFNAALGLTGDQMITTNAGFKDWFMGLVELHGGLENIPPELFALATGVDQSFAQIDGSIMDVINALPDHIKGPLLEMMEAGKRAGEGVEETGESIEGLGVSADAATDAVIAGAELLSDSAGQTQKIFGELGVKSEETNATLEMVGENIEGLNTNMGVMGSEFELLNANIEASDLLLKTSNETYETLNPLFEAYNLSMQAMLENQTLLNPEILLYNEQMLALYENQIVLNPLITEYTLSMQALYENQAVLNPEILLYSEYMLALYENQVVLNPEVLLYNEYMLTLYETQVLLNPEVLLYNEYMLALYETQVLLNPLIEAYTLQMVTLYENQAVLNPLIEEYTLQMVTLYENQAVLNPLIEEYTLAMALMYENYLLLNPQIVLFNESMTLLTETLAVNLPVLTEAIVAFNEIVLLLTEQMLLATESTTLFGTTITTTTEAIVAANMLLGESATALGTTITTAAGVVDTQAIAVGKSITDLATTMGTGATAIADAESKAGPAMADFAQAMKDVASAAAAAASIAKKAAGEAIASANSAKSWEVAAKSFSDGAKSYRDSASSSLAGALGAIDGSHASGLPYVPYDGYIAKLHRGEMIPTAEQSSRLRAGGTLGTPQASTRNTAASEDSAELKAIRKELELLRRESSQGDKETAGALNTIAGNSIKQTTVLNKVDRSNDQLARRLAVSQR